jgi:hypothetical protein
LFHTMAEEHLGRNISMGVYWVAVFPVFALGIITKFKN